MYDVHAGFEQRVDLGSRRQRVRVDDLGFASPQRIDVAHQLERIAHARSGADPAATGSGEPLHFARLEVEDVDDRPRHSEELAQRLDHGRRDGVRRLLGRDRTVDSAQDADAPHALLVRLGEPRVQRVVLDEQHEEHERRGQEPVGASRVEAQVEPAGVEHGGQPDVEGPRADDDDEPQVEHGVRPPPPEDDQRDERRRPDRGDDADHRRRVAVALHDRGQVLASRRGQRGEARDDDKCQGDASQDQRTRRARRQRCRDLNPVEQRIGDHEQRKPRVPEHVQPRGALRSGAEKAGGREQARKSQRVRDRDEGGEEVRAGQRQQPTRLQDAELAVEKPCGDEVIDDERRLIRRNERGYRRERDLGKGQRRQKDRGGHPHRHSREPAIAGSRWQRR